jgi:3-demethoxyubiquinol 3-hydroxylase
MNAAVPQSTSRESLASKYLRVDHAGEFGAIQIYRAQIQIGRLFRRPYVVLLEEFIVHERRHLATFTGILAERRIARCRSFFFCGIGGYVLGLITGLLGDQAIMVCTRSVETVVNRHLQEQLAHLQDCDPQAYAAVASIVSDELEHRDVAAKRVVREGIVVRVVDAVVAGSTEAVIWLGMRL